MAEIKKEAVPVPSVAADGEQLQMTSTSTSMIPTTPEKVNQGNDCPLTLEEMYREMQRMNAPGYMHTVTLNQLYDSVYQSRPPVIDGLLCAGTYLFAGAPKVGKSFFMAQLAYHVSTGQKLWDYEVHQGTVLYLALEDDYQRLQERMFRMFGVEGTDKLHFAVYAKQLGNGLDEQLKLFVEEHPDTKLIIIDTLQKIRELGGEAYSYADDYQIVSRLKQFADSHGVCLMIVHHTRKMPASDKFEMISGTTGLMGSADGAFVLQKEKRTDDTATLDVVGRDQPDQRLYLRKDEERLVWCLVKAERELHKEPPDPLLEEIASLITADRPVWHGSASELSNMLSLTVNPNSLTKKLNVRAGKLLIDYSIQYENTHGRSGSQITLRRVTETATL